MIARNMLHGAPLAASVKADIFAILGRIDDPWSTLGWFGVQESTLAQTALVQTRPTFFFALFGCTITGVALGFGRNFWNGLLKIVLHVRSKRPKAAEGGP